MQKMPLFRLAMCLIVFVFSACECDDVVSQLPSPQAVLADGSERTPPLPHLEVNLPPVVVGAMQNKDLDLWNEGDGKLGVSEVFLTTDPELCPTRTGAFSIVSPAAGNNGLRAFVVEAGARKVLSIAFTPSSATPSCAVLEVRTNDEKTPVLRALLTSQGDAAALCTNDAVVDFGSVYVGSVTQKTATLTSCGTRPIVLESISKNEFFPPFAVEEFALPLILNVGESLEIEFEFSPAVERSYALPATAGLFTVTTDAQGAAYQLALVAVAEREPSCELSVVPSLMNFGQVADGRNATQNLALSNRGQLDCNVSAMALQDATGAFSFMVGASFPLVLTPGQTHIATVTFAPNGTLGSVNNILLISSDDPVNPEKRIPLEGNAIEPTPCLIEANPTGVNFGNQAMGQSNEVTVVLTNVGSENCSVKEIALTTGNPDFTVIADTFPLIGSPVNTGNTLEFIVRYRPFSEGAHSGNIRVEFKEFGFGNPTQTLDIPLVGFGVAPQICVTPNNLDFGALSFGEVASETLSIANCGGVGFNLRGVLLRAGTHGGFSVEVQGALPRFFLPGEEILATVTAAPTVGQDLMMLGFVDVVSEDPNTPSVPVALRANAEGCNQGLVCAPSELDFGDIQATSAAIRSFTCTNYGLGDVSFSPSMVNGGSIFEVVTGPASVGAYETALFTVRFSPPSEGDFVNSIDLGAPNCLGGLQRVEVSGRGVIRNLPECPTPESFSPQVVWRFDGTDTSQPNSKQVWTTPLVSRLEDTNGDGVLTLDDMPRVVFISFDKNDYSGITGGQDQISDPTPGILRALDGATGAEIWAVTDPAYRVNSSVTPALADIDGDGFVEIIAQSYVLLEGIEDGLGVKIKGKFREGRLIAFEHDGTFKWMSDTWTRSEDDIEDSGAISVGDMNADGLGEIATGDHVFDYQGHLIFAGGQGTGGTGHGPISAFVDVDGILGAELITGRAAYRADGSTVWTRADLDNNLLDVPFDGHAVAADLDRDGVNEVVVRSGSGLYVFNGQTGQTLAGPLVPPTNISQGTECAAADENSEDCNPIPTHVAVFNTDEDPELEIVLSNNYVLLVYDRNLNEEWRTEVNDATGASGPAGFDFDADNSVNVVYTDESNAWVFDDVGNAIYDADRGSVTLAETAAIADVNNDGHANLVVGSNEPEFGFSDGLEVLSNAGTSWPHARGIWNQHAFVENSISELGVLLSPIEGAVDQFRAASAQCRGRVLPLP